MGTDFGEDLIKSLNQAVSHAKGQSRAGQVRVVTVPNVRLLRESLKMSQQKFALAFRIPLATLKGWEQGRRQPAYLSVIEKLPKEAQAALELTQR
ncbi:transcriptional regulator, XRE family [Duganella sp. CF458]|uniref:helix-turn-helix domain-containing protein n=1 Tax=Duganella sp. CF458 TaxID=1884368 RepID=UPI0008F1951D|nr:helix-turn-helix domain-containing protein [Duganella sp. CF458]SFH00927.1 transcriptional regulator, XRE family [Duganella sp. CF458]